tara:strand:+ start:65 stop:952 length:888 start_codon:yes stop_codon:yes gene_type:complete
MNLWVALDWGTSNFRAYLMDNNHVIDHVSTQEGMKFVDQNEFKKTLIKNIDAWNNKFDIKVVIASGMVGAKQGWIEVPYINSPCDIRNLNFKSLKILDDVKIHILSGVSQFNPSDVMRGEETQIAGFLLNNIDFNGSICLPGTHSKWVNLNSYNIQEFTTFLTGELYEIVKKYSILNHSLNTAELDDEIVKSAAKLIIENPSFISNKLFEIRAENLLKNSSQISNNSKLVGYLLGIELSGSRNYWEDKDLVIIGSSNLNKYYELILNGRSNSIQLFNSSDMALNGLSFFKKSLNL